VSFWKGPRTYEHRREARELRKPAIEDDTSTLKQELSRAWKRIADLETRIHDLTMQSTMDIPEETDLSYLDRGRLEEEYRKLMGLKKKAERYAVDAKQTAQRVCYVMHVQHICTDDSKNAHVFTCVDTMSSMCLCLKLIMVYTE